ncbi:MAG: glycosyltransferase family 4 protein [Patescibacteria group bacterium]|nr:glycosyltransferase family 4 protein [Patescibacteria group bacterium]
MKDRRTILVVAPYWPPQGGGLERYASEIATRLAKQHGWRAVVLTSGEKDEVEERDGLRIYRLKYQIKISNTPVSLAWFGAIRKLLEKENPDVINIHMPVPGIGDIAALAAGSRNIIITYHAGSMRKGALAADIIAWLYEHGPLRLLLRRADRIICTSAYIWRDFLHRYQHKSTIITPAVASVFMPDGASKAKDPTILFVGGLGRGERYKGLSTLLRACKEVSNLLPTVRVIIVGDGDMREQYEREAQDLGLGGRAEFAGRLSGSALVKRYNQAHVFALPTGNDNFPLTILEAMSCSLPVVSTRVGSIPDLVEEGETGFLIEPGDERALAQKLLLLLRDQGLAAAFGTSARTRVLKDFSWEERAQCYDAVLSRNYMAIVHVSAYYPPHLGGMEQRIRELAILQVRAGLDISVLTSNVGTPAGLYLQDGVKVFYLRALEFLHTPLALGLVWQLFRLNKNSLIHLHVAHAFFAEITAAVARIRGIPYIAHVRMLIIPSGRIGKLLLPLYTHFVLRWVFGGAAKIIVLTPDYKNILVGQFGISEEKIVVIPNATSFAVLEKPCSTCHAPLRLLAVGRISVQKNYPFLIDVAEALKHTHNLAFTLTIVGGGDREALETLVRKKNLESQVRLVGVKLGKDLETIYEESDVCVLASLMEGFSTVLLEAMAKGLPIVASNVVGTRNVIQDGRNGLLAPLSVGAMCKAIMRLVTEKGLYPQISAHNIEDVRNYDWGAILKTTLQTYETII